MYKLRLLGIALIGLLLGGCFKAVNLPQKNLYTLDPGTIPTKTFSGPTQKTLLVMQTSAQDAFDKKEMAYVIKPHQLAYFADNEWASEPSGQLTYLIAHALRRTHYFKAIVLSPFVGTTDFKLSTNLMVLQQNFLYRPSREQLVLTAQLINANTGKVIAGRAFTYSVKTKKNTPYGGVVAANKATYSLLKDLSAFVITHAR